MSAKQTLIARPGRKSGTIIAEDGSVLTPPEDWVLVPPGDAALTRRIKKTGPSWTVQEKRGRKTFSRGVWAPKSTVDRIRIALDSERSKPSYKQKLEAGRARRAREQEAYVKQFVVAVRAFLRFAPRYADLEATMARAVAEHATPVGSGTVARTKRIPVEQRAEAAVIAWMRHQTTAYERMAIPRVKGKRREVRAALAAKSRELLADYRRGEDSSPSCPLKRALR